MRLDEELWQAFFSETEEHLDALDRLLAATPWQAGELAAAFRAMHSLKGLSQAVGLPNMQHLTHWSEDLLGVLRARQDSPDRSLLEVLVAVTDRLRSMREWVQQHGTDPPQDAAVAARLDEAVKRLVPAAEPPPPPQEAVAPLAEDGEMLALYCELLEEGAANLALLLTEDPALRRAGQDQAETLATGASVLGFEQLADDLQALVSLDPASLPAISEIAAQLGLVEEMTGFAAGAARLSAALAEVAGQDADRRLKALWPSVEAAARGDELDWQALLPGARAARIALAAAGREVAAGKLLLLEEALAGLAQPHADAGAEAEASLDLLRARCRALLDDPGLDGVAATAAPQPDGLARLHLRPELQAVITPAKLARLEDRLAAGDHAYTLLLDLESGENASNVVAWLSAATEVVTNCTVPTSIGRSWFEFLVLYERPITALRAELAALDPDKLCVHDVQSIGDASHAGIPATGAPGMPVGVSPVIRVPVDTIDRLMDEVSELRVALGAVGEAMRAGELARELRALPGGGALLDQQEGLDELLRRVWNRSIELRVVPADTLFGRFPRLVRDLAQALGKPADLEIRGHTVRLDKSMADALVDPLMHMLRNAMDHGVEPPARRREAGKPDRAHLVLTAAEQGDGIVVTVEDDGAGLDRAQILARAVERGLLTAEMGGTLSDREVFDLLFRPGFSTATEITEISGRGVGLDVVAAVVQRLGGRIDIRTRVGFGTAFALSLPSSASLQSVLLVQAPQTLALPERGVVGALMLADALVDHVGTRAMLWFEAAPIPLVSLAGLLGLGCGAIPDPARQPEASVVIVGAAQARLALAVDSVPLRRELFLKELHPLLARLPAVAGGAVLGDGSPVLVLNVEGLIALARSGQTGATVHA